MTSSAVARTTVGLVIAVAIGTAMAGGIRQAPDAVPGRVYGSRSVHLAVRAGGPPARAASPHGGLAYDVLALFVLATVLLVIVWAYYRFKLRRLRAEQATVDGWRRVLGHHLRELWECPACGSLTTLAMVDQHQERSACGAYERWLADNEGTEEGRPIRAKAPAWIGSMTATVPPDHSVNGGGYDTLSTANQDA